MGRDRELSALQALVEGARRRTGAAIVVHGEPGIGKTALVEEFVARSELRSVHACGFESEGDLPFATLGDLIRPLLAALRAVPSAQADAIGRALGLAHGAGIDPADIEVATVTLLSVATAEEPLVVVVDDLPWADTSSRSAILHVARRAATLPLVVVLAARTQDLSPAMAELPGLALAPLSDADAVSLLLDDAPDVGAVVLDSLVERGHGNPLALHELLRGLTVEQRTGIVHLDDPIPIAEEVLVAYRDRVDRLPEATRQALLLAVAEGRGHLPCVVDALDACSSTVSAFEPAERDRLVALHGGAVHFRHPLVRSVVYQTADVASRRSAHLLLASVDQDPDRRAWHLARAAAGPDAEAAKAMTQLGERALARGADATAARALSRAAELTSLAGEQGQLYAKAARAANRGGDPPLAAKLLGLARPLVSDDPMARADLAMLDADLRMRHGDLERAYIDLAGQAEAVATLDPRRAMVMLLMAAKLHVYRMEAAAGLSTVRRAMELTADAEPDLLQMASLTMTAAMAGDPQAVSFARAAAEMAMSTRRGHLHTLSIAWPLVWLEEHDLARRFLVWAIGIQREGGHHSYLPQSLLPAAELDFRTGRWAQARAGAYEARQLFTETNQPVDAALAAGVIARIEAACGEEEGCRSQARAATDADATSGLMAASAFAHAGLGQLALSTRRFDEAVGHLRRAAAIAQRGGVGEPRLLAIHGDLVDALVRVGDMDAARLVAADVEVHAGRAQATSARALASRCHGLLAPDDSFALHFREAIRQQESMDSPFELARTCLGFGERLHRAHHRAEARGHLRRAAEIFDELGAASWAAGAATQLRAAGGERRRSDDGGLPQLSRRERDVAIRVARGMTNKEVAQELFVNEKTVEFHLGNVYRKLALRSRSELTRAFARTEDSETT